MANVWGFGSDDPLCEDVFCLWLDHGTRPGNAAYAYVVYPGVTVDALTRYVDEDRARVLANEAGLQAVRHDGAGVTGAVFYEAGSVSLGPDLNVTVDKPCILLTREVSGGLEAALANPAGEALEVLLTVNGVGTPVSLPGGEYAGKSESVSVRLAN